MVAIDDTALCVVQLQMMRAPPGTSTSIGIQTGDDGPTMLGAVDEPEYGFEIGNDIGVNCTSLDDNLNMPCSGVDVPATATGVTIAQAATKRLAFSATVIVPISTSVAAALIAALTKSLNTISFPMSALPSLIISDILYCPVKFVPLSLCM
jgi:hypothetical protein